MTEHKRIILKFIKANRNLYDSEIAKKIKAKHYELFLVMQFTSLRRRISEMRQEFNVFPFLKVLQYLYKISLKLSNDIIGIHLNNLNQPDLSRAL